MTDMDVVMADLKEELLKGGCPQAAMMHVCQKHGRMPFTVERSWGKTHGMTTRQYAQGVAASKDAR